MGNNLKRELEDQEQMFKEKIKGYEKVCEGLQARIEEKEEAMKKSDQIRESKKELNALETRNEQLEKEKMIILKEKNETFAELEKMKKDLKRCLKEKETLVEE